MSISRIWRAGVLFALLSLGITAIAADAPRQSPRVPAQDLDALRPVDAPIVLCIDDKPTVGGQPSGQAYAKAVASGFRSVLTLRSPNDGVDLLRERLMVEKNRLRYSNLPALSALPRLDQVDEFLRLVRDPVNHPMLINCAFAERVAPYMMIFRMVEQGWSKDKAIEEAVRSGLRAEPLKTLAREYASRLKATKH
jgi:protein tyrosine phosphatase (PTP) superfamily phosphohydrolase (DUF442 family)